MRMRLAVLLMVFSALWGLLLARAAYLQLLPNERLSALQKKQFETVVTLKSRRGDVYDRNGRELAVSITAYSLFADPKVIVDPHRTARILSRHLHEPYKAILTKLKQKRKRFIWLARRLERSTRDAIAEADIHGLGFIEESRRVYPNEQLLSHALGFIGSEGHGLEGLEARYDEVLEASARTFSMKKDARGRPLLVNGQLFTEAPDGSDIHLTIDRELQYVLEQELASVVREQKAESAVGIVLEAQTSEILAIASVPTFDANQALSASPEHRRNRTVTDAYEPGSVMKTFLIGGALQRGLIEPNTRFDCGDGVLRLGNRVIREADVHHNFKNLTVSEILAHSSNVGSSRIALHMGDEALRDTLLKFGFGEKTGVDLPGEAKGILQPLPWREHLLANISFGHGIAATPLQVANAYAAIANGGWLKQPFIVKQVRDHETDEVIETKPRTTKKVLNDASLSKLRIMLMAATGKEATGVNARVAGYPVAGKTGTAQKVNPKGGYYKDAYISSFAGFLPANDPRFVIYIAVDNPRKDYYGSAVAAPVFAHVARFAVRRAGLAPVLINEGNIVPQGLELETEAPPETQPEAIPVAPLLGKVDGGPLLNPVAALSPIEAALHTLEQKSSPVVPDWRGLSLRTVLERAHAARIDVSIQGQGFVTHTVPSAGSPLPNGESLRVVLSASGAVERR